jgi:hypothetical protein
MIFSIYFLPYWHPYGIGLLLNPVLIATIIMASIRDWSVIEINLPDPNHNGIPKGSVRYRILSPQSRQGRYYGSNQGHIFPIS